MINAITEKNMTFCQRLCRRLICTAAASFGIAQISAAVAASLPISASTTVATVPMLLDQHLDQLSHTSFTSRDGAPTSTHAMEQGPNGFLWMGADKGLVRFDGIRFERNTIPGLPDLPVYAIHIDDNNDMWLSFLPDGIAHVHDGQVDFMQGHGLPDSPVFGIYRTSDGVLWAVAYKGVARFIHGRWQPIDASMGYTPVHPDAALQTADKALWISDSRLGFVFEPAEKHFREVRIDDFIQTELGLDPANSQQLPLYSRTGVRDASGANWILFKQGIERYRWHGKKNPEVEKFTPADGLTSANVSGLYQDHDGDVWAWTDRGLDRFRGSKLTPITLPGSPTLPAIALDGNDGLWVTGQNDPIMHIVDGQVVPIPNTNEKGADCLFLARDNVLWWAGSSGVGLLEDGHAKHIPAIARLQNIDGKLYQALAVDRSGGLWASVIHFGLFYRKDGRWRGADPTKGLTSEAPTRIVIDDRDRLWLTYANNQVVVNDHGNVHAYGSKDGLSLEHVFAIELRGTHVWVGGTQGVEFLHSGRFTPLLMPDGDPLKGVTGIVETASGELWVNDVDGIRRFSKADIANALVNPAYVNHPRLFDHTDGVNGETVQLSPLPTLLGSDDGKLWGTTNNGVFLIDPARLRTNPKVLMPIITHFLADTKSYLPGSALTLPKLTRRVQIDYTAPYMAAPERIQFKYRLSHVDHDWQQAGTRRQAFYTNLAPGHYAFQVEAANEDGLWSTHPARLTFYISPAWYQTWWFKVAIGLVVLLLLATIFLARTRYVADRAEIRFAERERIARELHDTLLQSSQGLIYRLGTALKKVAEPEPRIMLIDAIEQAQDVLVEARGRVGELRGNNNETVDLVGLLTTTAATMLRGHNLKFQFELIGTPRPVMASVAIELQTMSQEILANVISHAKASSVAAAIKFQRRCVTVEWLDDGQGIDPAILKKGGREGHWGLQGLRERATSIKSRIHVARRVEAGTSVSIRVPTSVAYRPKLWRRRSRRH